MPCSHLAPSAALCMDRGISRGCHLAGDGCSSSQMVSVLTLRPPSSTQHSWLLRNLHHSEAPLLLLPCPGLILQAPNMLILNFAVFKGRVAFSVCVLVWKRNLHNQWLWFQGGASFIHSSANLYEPPTVCQILHQTVTCKGEESQ